MKTRKAVASNWLIMAFLLLLLVSAAISEFFQAPTTSSQELSRYTALFNADELHLVRHINISNKLGTYQIARLEPFDQNRWQLTAPRNLDANNQTMGLVLETLRNITIKKIFDKDPINMASFSLNTPVMTIEIDSMDSDSKTVLQVGLTNTIDSTTYLTIKGQDAIYQTEVLKYPIETFDLAQFINTNLFIDGEEVISSIALYRGKNAGNALFSLENKDGNWQIGGKAEANVELISEFLDSLQKSKGQIILDTLTEKQEPLVTKMIQQPLYTLVLKLNTQETIFYISAPITTIPGIKVEKGQSVIISSPQKSYPVVASKDILNLFSKNYNFKGLPVKKLFY